MARSTREAALRTRERILDAALEVFHEHGVARASLRQIAGRAGLTHGAVYGHFQNKADLFSALTDRVRLPMEALAGAEADYHLDPLGALRRKWIYLLRRTARDPVWRRTLDVIFHRCEWVAESGLIQQRMQLGHSDGAQAMGTLLRQAVQRRQLPADLDVEAAATLLFASFIGVLRNCLFDPEGSDLADSAERWVDALLAMLHHAAPLRRAEPAADAAHA